MKQRSIISQLRNVYRFGNKLVRIGMWLVAIGGAFLIPFAAGIVYLWLTDFPKAGVLIPQWMVGCMMEGMVWPFVGALLIVIGSQLPGGGGGKRKRDRFKGTWRAGAQAT